MKSEFNVEGVVLVLGVSLLAIQHDDDHPAIRSVEAPDVLHLLISQLEVKDVSVLHNPGWSNRLGDDDDTSLYLPPDQHLGRALAVLGCNLLQLGVLQQVGITSLGPGSVR